MPTSMPSKALTKRLGRYKPDISTRKVAVLAAVGIDMISVRRVMQELTDAGLQCQVVAPHLGHIGTASCRTLAVISPSARPRQ
jgi:catalase